MGTSINLSPLFEEQTHWQNIIATNPSYVHGYLQLAKVEVELGNKDKALNLIKEALLLDPNSPEVPMVTQKLGL